MKYIVWLLVVSGIIAIVSFNKRNPLIPPPPSPSPSSAFGKSLFGLSEHEDVLVFVEVEGKKYRVAWEIIADPTQISVGVNDDLASSSAALKSGNNCTILTSGGFYQTSGKPIGLVISSGVTISSWEQNQLFNGVIGFGEEGLTIRRGRSETQTYSWALQAGPVVWEKSKPIDLRLNKDQDARRIVAGVTTTNQLMLAVVTAEDSLFSGPLLEDLPKVIGALQETANVEIEAAINMDGGTASAYFGSKLMLKELKPIGSFVCVNQR